MSLIDFRLRRLALFTALLFTFVAPVSAQNTPGDSKYPTVAALEAAVIPLRDRVELAERLRGVDPATIPPTPASAVARQVGEQQDFTASNDDNIVTIPATLRVVGEHIYLWVENGAQVNDSDLQALAGEFDSQIYPNVRDLWGSEASPGIDGDARIYGLFAHGLGASVAAYFASDHTFPREIVPVSNEHEMFFFNLDALGSGFSLRDVSSIVAHEFQHMIRANLQIDADTWLNEGLSEFTQYHFYDDLSSSVLSFLSQPETQLNDWNADPNGRAANYGAAALFFIYFEQRYGLDAMRALSADYEQRGLQAVDDTLRALGEPGAPDSSGVNELFADWVMANGLFDAAYGDGRYGYTALPPLRMPPVETADYPYQERSRANQYGTVYHIFTGLEGAAALDIQLDAPASTSLIPTLAASGVRFWYSNRADMGDARLTRAFDLSDVQSATLNYRVWYDTEADWDYGYVMVSDDDGATWNILSTPNSRTDDPQRVAYGAGYNGASGRWIDESLPLDAYAGEPILVRFEMITDDAVTRPGIALDDVRIPEIGYTDDFETDDGGWQAQGWLWTDNRLPQGGWVQVAQQDNGETVSVERWQVGESAYHVELAAGVDQVLLAISPFAPVTTVAMSYTLTVERR
ncbi:MAG: hypothetical protein ABI835_05030 [Chloroflexota bacterium]